MEKYDLVVIGAGVYGLPVAKTYLEVNPLAHVLILDAGRTVGGTWSLERLYDGLQTNNLVGMLEYSDFPMDLETFGVKPGSHVPGIALHRYLTAYAERFGIFDKIRFEAFVKSAELKEDGTWVILYEKRVGEEGVRKREVLARKLVMATGTTSEPNMPEIRGASDFGGRIFHFKEFQNRKEEMEAAHNIAVLGGSKSAADAIYLNALKGKHVDWIIRASGRGPAWLTAPFVSPAHLQFEKLATTRIMSWLSPSIDSDCYPWIRRLLHNTCFGRAFLRTFFGIIKNDGIQRGKFLDHPETKKLIPKDGIEWIGTTVSTFNYPTELFDLVQEGLINIHIADIEYLSTEAIHLSDSSSIKAEVLICATGWDFKSNISFLPCNLEDKIGLSKTPSSDPNIVLADEELLRRFPEFEDSPMKRVQQPVLSDKQTTTPEEPPSWVLYHGLVPPHFVSSRNFAYVGMALGIRGFLLAQTQALWITAFLDEKLSTPLPSEEEASKQALLQNRFYKWRAPKGLGDRCTDMVLEVMPYVDTLLTELGLETRRKGGWAEIFQYYGVGDYPNLVQEWLGTQEK